MTKQCSKHRAPKVQQISHFETEIDIGAWELGISFVISAWSLVISGQAGILEFQSSTNRLIPALQKH